MKARYRLLAVTAMLSAAAPTWAQGWLDHCELTADVGVQLRSFFERPRWAGQSGGAAASLSATAAARWHGEGGRASFQPYLRLDQADHERNHFDLREAYWAWEGDGWEWLAGANKVFWGVAESRHLVDVINQTDLADDPDQEEKLGQPMIRGVLESERGQWEVYLMPWFRERTFPGTGGRLRAPLPVDTKRVEYESSAGARHVDLALRWSHYIGDLDIGAYLFRGTGREPVLLPDEAGGALLPHYHVMTQVGLDAQYTRGEWLWKLEAIARKGREDRFIAAVAGFEYTRYGVMGSAMDVGLLAEYLYDGRAASEPATPFDDDVFFGARVAWNDASDTTLLAGLVSDRRTSARFFNLEMERRLKGSLVGELRLRFFEGRSGPRGLASLDQDDYVDLRLVRYF